MAQPTARRNGIAMGYLFWNHFPAFAELFLFSDIRFSTGGAAGMSFCNLAFEVTFCPFLYHFLVGSLFNYNLSILDNWIIGPNVRSFIAVWIWACLCIENCNSFPAGHFMVGSLFNYNISILDNCILGPNVRGLIAVWIWTCLCIENGTPFPAGHFMEVNINRCLFLTVSSFILQAFMQVYREFQTALVEQFLHCGVIASVRSRIAQGMQFGYVFLSWSHARQQLGTECAPWLPTCSRFLAIVNLHMSGYESRAIRCSAFWLHGLGFRLKGRQLSRSVAEKFWGTFGHIALQSWKFSADLHNFSGITFPVLVSFYRAVGKVFYPASGLCKFCLNIQRLFGWCACLQCWPLLYFVTVQLADGADLEPYSMDSASECPLFGSEPSSHSKASTPWLVPFLCSALCLLFTWVLRKWWKFLPSAPFMEGVDDTMIGAMFDRINAESDSLRREVNFLNGQLSELSSVVRRLREDLYEVSADHERLAEQV